MQMGWLPASQHEYAQNNGHNQHVSHEWWAHYGGGEDGCTGAGGDEDWRGCSL